MQFVFLIRFFFISFELPHLPLSDGIFQVVLLETFLCTFCEAPNASVLG